MVVNGLSSQTVSCWWCYHCSGLSTDSLRQLDGRHSIGFNTSFLLLNTSIGTTAATGIVTSISVTAT